MPTVNSSQRERAPVISAGSAELDKTMGGGIPLQSLTLIEGQSGAGKSTLTQHLLWGAMTSGEDAILYTSENTVQSLLHQMKSLRMDPINYFLLDYFRIYRIHLDAEKNDPEPAFRTLLAHIRSQPNYSVVALDSLSTFITQASGEQILGFFSQCQHPHFENGS